MQYLPTYIYEYNISLLNNNVSCATETSQILYGFNMRIVKHSFSFFFTVPTQSPDVSSRKSPYTHLTITLSFLRPIFYIFFWSYFFLFIFLWTVPIYRRSVNPPRLRRCTFLFIYYIICERCCGTTQRQ